MNRLVLLLSERISERATDVYSFFFLYRVAKTDLICNRCYFNVFCSLITTTHLDSGTALGLGVIQHMCMLHEVTHILHVACAHLFNVLSEPSIMTSVARPFYARERCPE